MYLCVHLSFTLIPITVVVVGGGILLLVVCNLICSVYPEAFLHEITGLLTNLLLFY